MDEIDNKIIELLKKDASTPLSKIADRIGIPRPTAYLRFNKMKEAGIIRGFTIILGRKSDGPLKAAFLTLKDYLLSDMGDRTMKSLGEKLALRPEVIFAVKISKNKMLIMWEGSSFHPVEFKEVVAVEEIETEVYKAP